MADARTQRLRILAKMKEAREEMVSAGLFTRKDFERLRGIFEDLYWDVATVCSQWRLEEEEEEEQRLEKFLEEKDRIRAVEIEAEAEAEGLDSGGF
jgi:hypothetical protein